MLPPTIFELHKKRDFGAVISDTFTYLRQNFKPLLRAILIIAGPFLLLSAIYLGLAQSYNYTFGSSSIFSNVFNNYSIVGYLFVLIADLLLFTVIHSYVLSKSEHENAEEVKVELVWQYVKKYIWRSLSICLAFFVLIVIGTVIITLIITFFGSVFSSALGAIIAVIAFFAVIYIFFRLAYIFPAGLVDDYHTGDSFIRSWSISKGYFWNNFGIAFIFGVLIMMVAIFASMPKMIYVFIIAKHGGNLDINPVWKFIGLTIQIIGTLLAHLSYCLPLIAYVLQYFSAVEKTEGIGLLQKIENMEIKPEDDSWGEESY